MHGFVRHTWLHSSSGMTMHALSAIYSLSTVLPEPIYAPRMTLCAAVVMHIIIIILRVMP
jgi:hypothetical protein